MASRMNYKILLSAHGTGPTKYGVSIPLTFDTMALKSAYGIYPFPNHSNMHGKLSISGQDILASRGGTSKWPKAEIHFHRSTYVVEPFLIARPEHSDVRRVA